MDIRKCLTIGAIIFIASGLNLIVLNENSRIHAAGEPNQAEATPAATTDQPTTTPIPPEPTATPKDMSLFDGIRQNNLELVQAALDKKLNVNDTNIDGYSPLLLAVRNDNLELVQKLVAAGADVKFATWQGTAALHIAATRGHSEMVKFLLDKGADAKVKDSKDLTPLLCAIPTGKIDIIEMLINAKSDLKATDTEFKNTALHTAALMGFKDICALLITNKAEVNAKNLMQKTPLHLAATGFYPLKSTFEPKLVETAQLLVENGADLQAIDVNGNTALHDAVLRGRKVMVQFLINAQPAKKLAKTKQSLPNIKNDSNKLPIDIAKEKLAEDNTLQVMQEIIDVLNPITTPTPVAKNKK
jgi:ankyrin repeat protein